MAHAIIKKAVHLKGFEDAFHKKFIGFHVINNIYLLLIFSGDECLVIDSDFKPLKFTCHKCDEVDTCVYAFDLYNINRDCLANK